MQRPDSILIRLRRRIASFLADRSGSLAMISVLILPGVFAVGGAALDYSRLTSARAQLRTIADSAALAAVSEFRLGATSLTHVVGRANDLAQAGLQIHGLTGTVAAHGDNTQRSVTVVMTATVPMTVMSVFGFASSEVSTTSTARMVGGAPLCVIGLDSNENQTVEVDRNARLDAPGCTVYSNSTKPHGLIARKNATIRAGFICSAGGKSSPGRGSFSPEPQTDCPFLPDPLLSRQLPTAGMCWETNLVINGGVRTLRPGAYCGGLTISGGARVRLDPGVYIFRNGPLRVTGGAVLQGVNVGFHFSGTGAALEFEALSSVSLTAPRVGEMAGILFSEDRAGPAKIQHRIMSDDARTLLGTIYFPRSEFYVGANRPVSDRSAYTIVVVRKFSLSEGPTMVLNINYGATDIPVPNGVGPTGGNEILTR
jgi:Flp pilus assembly protein TadG